MSIVSEVNRLKDAKTAIKTAIEGKGVTVPDATMLEGMAALIDSIEAGGGIDSFSFASVLNNATCAESGTYTIASDATRITIPTIARSTTHTLRMVLLWADEDATNLGMFGLRGNKNNGLNGFQAIMTFIHGRVNGIVCKPSLTNSNAQFEYGDVGYGGGGKIQTSVNGIMLTPYSNNFTAGTTYNYIVVSEVK